MSPGGGDGDDKNGATFPSIRNSITSQTSAYWRSAPLRRLRHPLEEAPIWGILCTLLGEIVTFLIGVPVLALLLPVLVIAKITRIIIHYRHREQSSSINSEHDPEKVDPSAILHAVLILESSGSSQSLDVTSWRSVVTSRLIQQYPRLRCRPHLLPLGRRCWFEDTCFDINQHVVDERNEEPSAWTTPDKLQRYVASLVDTKLPADRPPWEMRLLLRTEDLVAIIRVHKDVADATTLVKFLSHALDDEASTFQAKAINGDFWYSLKNFIRAALVGPFTVFLWLLFTVPECNVFTEKTKWEGSSSIYWSDAITLPKVTRIKQVTRSTTGCVLISALAGSARIALQAYGIRNPADMSALIPILVSSPQRNSLPEINESENVWSPGILRMPISTEGAVPRLWSTRSNLKDLKQSTDPTVFFLASKVISYITPKSWSLSSRFRNNLKTKASLQFTTAPGLRHRVRILGYNVKCIYALVPPDPCVGLTVSAFSYHDHIYITILSDKSLSPAAKLLLKNMHCQIEQLWQLLINRRVPGESPPLERRIDITTSPVKELRLRLSNVQLEVEEELKKCHLPKTQSTRTQVNAIVSTKKDSACPNLPSDERLEGLRSEFSAILNELYRRRGSHAENKIDEWDIEDSLFRPRRRALSCSSSSVHRSLFDKFNSIARPTSCIETSSSTILVSKNSGTCCFVAPNNLSSPDERLRPVKNKNIKIKDDCSAEDQSDIIEGTTDSSYRRSTHEELDYIQLPMEEEEEETNKYDGISNLPETSKADEKVKFWLTNCPTTICETISERNNLPNKK